MRKRIFVLSIILGILCASCGSNCFAEDYKISEIACLKTETERLILTPTTISDLEVLSEYLLDYDVAKYIDPSVENGFSDKEQALQFLKTENKNEYDEALSFTIKLKDSNIPIGEFDVMLCHMDNKTIAMFGYWLGKDFQKKGYAREACYSICSKVLNASDVNSIYIACDSRNMASINLASDILNYLEKSNKHLNLDNRERLYDIEISPEKFITMRDFLLIKII